MRIKLRSKPGGGHFQAALFINGALSGVLNFRNTEYTEWTLLATALSLGAEQMGEDHIIVKIEGDEEVRQALGIDEDRVEFAPRNNDARRLAEALNANRKDEA